jgi:glycosyltransferase involved in cell wall biosynthesis
MQPLVSVRVITYNHEKYIEQCLEGILMQRTSFPFEVIVGEHSSVDRTQKIVMDYGHKYPEQVRVFITGREEPPIQNLVRVQQACRGTYQALCEGDDYWIDPLKLQKQVDLLEANPDMTMCFHNAFVTRENIFNARYYFRTALKERLSFADVCLLSVPTASILARSSVLNTLPEWRARLINGDRLMRLWCAHHGPLGYLTDVMSVYRKHGESMLHKMQKSRQDWYASTVYLCSEFDKETHYQHSEQLRRLVHQARQYSQRSRWGRTYYLLHPRQSVAKLKNLCMAIKRR